MFLLAVVLGIEWWFAEKRLKTARDITQSLAERVYIQSGLLSRKAERVSIKQENNHAIL